MPNTSKLDLAGIDIAKWIDIALALGLPLVEILQRLLAKRPAGGKDLTVEQIELRERTVKALQERINAG